MKISIVLQWQTEIQGSKGNRGKDWIANQTPLSTFESVFTFTFFPEQDRAVNAAFLKVDVSMDGKMDKAIVERMSCTDKPTKLIPRLNEQILSSVRCVVEGDSRFSSVLGKLLFLNVHFLSRKKSNYQFHFLSHTRD